MMTTEAAMHAAPIQPMDGGTAPICEISELSVSFRTTDGHLLHAVGEVSLSIAPGEALGVVGESGSGKTMLGMSILGLLPSTARIGGDVVMDGVSVIHASQRELARLRGRRIGLILQDPTASLNPVRTIRSQLREAARHGGIPRSEISSRIRDGLAAVGLDAGRVLRSYPHQLSGGMNQRVAIAMALVQDPELLIADEPTTALDVSSQSDIVALINGIRAARSMALVFVSHDLNVVAAVADRVAVMYAGRLVEIGARDEILAAPSHPYTLGLIESTPSLEHEMSERAGIPGQLEPVLDDATGCPFFNRCPRREDRCRTEQPPGVRLSDRHTAWCWAVAGARTEEDA